MSTSKAVGETPPRFSGFALYGRRVDRGLSRTQLGAAVNRSADAIRSYEAGASVPPGDVVAALAHALDSTVDSLYAAVPSAASA